MKIRLLSLLALVALVALTSTSVPLSAQDDGSGGKAIAHGPSGRPASAAAQKKAPDARMFRIDHGAGEPTLGITKKGNVFITTADSCVTSCPGSEEMIGTVAPGGRAVWVTKDGGKSWQDVTPTVEHALSLDPYIYVDESTDRVFDVDLTVACSELSYSDDEGELWVTNPVACGEPVNDHQTVFSGPPVSSPTVGYPNIVYYCFNHPAFTKCSKSLNGGISFMPTANIVPPDCSGLNGHGITDREGTVYLPMANCGPTLAISRDEGDTWEVMKVSSMGASPGGDPSVAISNGVLYYLFVGADGMPYLVTSSDGGRTWTEPMDVAPSPIVETNLATIDVGDAGKVAIAYYGTTGGDSWNGYLAIGRGVLGKNPLFYTASINDPAEPFKVNGCGPGRCGRVLDFIDVEIGPNGQAWGAYVDACLKECEKTGTENIHDNQGVVGTLIGGFRLR
jgi:hypothetical protein